VAIDAVGAFGAVYIRIVVEGVLVCGPDEWDEEIFNGVEKLDGGGVR